MTIFLLGNPLVFPDPEESEPDGMLAIGGDLKPERILLAYKMGIFPWYSKGRPILWWSPDPRLIIFPRQIHISKSLKRVLKSGKFDIKFDTRFEDVIKYCARVKRPGQEGGTWITDDMTRAYCRLHELGFCHSAEAFSQGELVGGLYGLSLGKAFFGESMFSLERDASKAALAALCRVLARRRFDFVDCQIPTDHLKTMGAFEITRREFLELLSKTLAHPSHIGKWTELNRDYYDPS